MTEKKSVYLVGIGMGTREGLTLEAKNILETADVFLGARRMLELVPEGAENVYASYQPEEINQYLTEHPDWNKACVLLSGDVGFYSGAKKLLEALKDFEVILIPGISSLVYFCAKLQIPWEDISCVSLHGKSENIMSRILRNHYTFALLGNGEDIHRVCEKLSYYQMEQVTLHIGERLGYPQERVIHGRPARIRTLSFEKLVVVVIENPEPISISSCEIADELFIRGKVPMTKSEVRSVCVQKLGLGKESVLYDIGAGTGSVSIQAAYTCPDCQVYAIERKKEAVGLLEQNKRKFVTDNVSVVEGIAPDVLQELPVPTHAFIGGSAGRMEEILCALWEKNPRIRIVITAISVETVSEVLTLLEKYHREQAEMVQISVAKAKASGSHHLMIGQNPVTVITIPSLCTKNMCREED